jgi:hypothetical protein
MAAADVIKAGLPTPYLVAKKGDQVLVVTKTP